MKKIVQLLVTFSFAIVAVFGTVSTVSIETVDASNDLIRSNNITESQASDSEPAKNLMGKIMSAAQIFAGFVLAISVIVIVYGGLKYVLSQGDSKAAEQGKMLIIYAGIGIFVALSAFIIIKMFIGFT